MFRVTGRLSQVSAVASRHNSRRLCAASEPAPEPAHAENEPDTGPVKWPVPVEEGGTRLDRFIKRRAPGLPTGLIQRLIRQRRVLVNGEPANRNAQQVWKKSVVEFPGDVKLGLSRGKKKPKDDDVTFKDAEFIRSRVLHKDARCVVLDKPADLPTQGGTGIGNRHVEALLPGLGDGRYFLVHRLDREVGGALAVARDVGAAADMADMFRKRKVQKLYWALVDGKVPAAGGSIKMDIDGKAAETHYRVVQNLDGFGAWLALRPLTGRKHQLRIHCAMGLKCRIVGESRYGGPELEESFGYSAALESAVPNEGIAQMVDSSSCGLHLHARSLAFPKLTQATKGRGKKGVGEISVTAPLSPHMRSSFFKFGLVEGHGNDLDW